MNFLFLRLSDVKNREGGRLLEIQVLDRYDPEKYGQPGDTVSFRSAVVPPGDKAVTFESLRDYKVVSKKR